MTTNTWTVSDPLKAHWSETRTDGEKIVEMFAGDLARKLMADELAKYLYADATETADE